MSALSLSKNHDETKIPAEKNRYPVGNGVKLPEREFFHKGFFEVVVQFEVA